MKAVLLNFPPLLKTMVAASTMVLCFITMSWSQSIPLPSDHPIAVAAPHLPAILRHDGIGKPIYGDKYTYKGEENAIRIKEWMRNYPEEVIRYKEAIAEYLKNTNVDLISENERELYHDLNSQWMLVRQM